MSGKIVYQPPTAPKCKKPPARCYRIGTIWKCDDCGTKWRRRYLHPGVDYWQQTMHLWRKPCQ